MAGMRSVWQIFAIGLRQRLTYRFDLLIEILCTLFARAFLSIIVWQDVLSRGESKLIGGYAGGELLIYFVLVSLLFDLNTMRVGYVGEEIYRGLLSKFLLMPINFFLYKSVAWLGRSCVYLIPITFALGYFRLFTEYGPASLVTLKSLCLGLLICVLGNILNVALYSAVELLTFWSDRVWSVSLLIHQVVYFAGGILFPIGALPEPWAELLRLSPFYLMIGFPAEVLLGHVDQLVVIKGVFFTCTWIAVFFILSNNIWRRGIIKYGASGI